MARRRAPSRRGGAGVMVDVELPNSPEAAAQARNALRRLADRLPERRLRDLRLLVSELVTNAFRHAGLGPDDRIRLRAKLSAASIRVEVHDSGRGFKPRRVDPDPARTSGWGLYLVETLANRWGVDRDRQTCVWFELDRPATGSPGGP